MQFRTALVPLALTALAAATTTVTVTTPSPPLPTPMDPNQCETGPIQCCNSVQAANAPGGLLGVPILGTLLSVLGLVISPINAIVGVDCTPITVIGGGGNSCSAQPVCCQNNSFNGLIAIGCTPVSLNL